MGASVRDGETFVIGGLTRENTPKANSKAPLLSDIPMVGQAFPVRRITRGRTAFYVQFSKRLKRQ